METIPNALKKGHHAKKMVVEHQTIFEVNFNDFLIFNPTIQLDSLGMDGINRLIKGILYFCFTMGYW